MRLFVFGHGYSADAAVARLAGRAEVVGVTTRTAEKAARLSARGLPAFVFDGTAPTPGLADALRSADAVLVSIAPGARDPVLAHYGAALATARRTAVVYLSTVGVYGDHGGRRVDERTPPKPVSERSVARLSAEAAWTRLAEDAGLSVAILRLSGIYGPGRNAFVNLADGSAKRIVKPGQVFNRIHVADIAAAVDQAFRFRASGVFNVTDDEPAPPQDVVAFAAALMGVEPPPEQDFSAAALSPMARSFYGENKRVANAKSKRDLGLTYAYPTYRDGLGALWASGAWRG